MLHCKLATSQEEMLCCKMAMSLGDWEILLEDSAGGLIAPENGNVAGGHVPGRHCEGRHYTMSQQHSRGDVTGRWCMERCCAMRW